MLAGQRAVLSFHQHQVEPGPTAASPARSLRAADPWLRALTQLPGRWSWYGRSRGPRNEALSRSLKAARQCFPVLPASLQASRLSGGSFHHHPVLSFLPSGRVVSTQGSLRVCRALDLKAMLCRATHCITLLLGVGLSSGARPGACESTFCAHSCKRDVRT